MSLWMKSSACAASLLVDDIAESGGILLGCFRFRSMDMCSSIAGAAGFAASGFSAVAGAAGKSSRSISSSSSGP